MSDPIQVTVTPPAPITVTVSGGVGPQGPAGAGGVTTLQGLSGALTLAAVGGTWSVAGSTITLTVTAAGSVAWADITGKPATFAPAAHTHAIADTTGLQAALDGKQAAGSYAAASHTHTASAVTDFSAAALLAVTWATLTGKPTFATVATTGAYSDLTGLPTIPSAYTLPTATASTLGGIKIGSGLTIDGAGVVTAAGTYTLPAATSSTLGGVIVGTGLSVASGTVAVAYGTSSTTACVGNDSRLSDARTPTAHNQAWSTITSTPTTLAGYGITDGLTSSSLASPPAIGGTTPAAGTFTVLAATSRANLPSGAAGSPAARDLYAVADTLRYRDSSNAERLLLNATDNLANLASAATARANLGAQKTITTGTAAPSGGSDGDIYLRYS